VLNDYSSYCDIPSSRSQNYYKLATYSIAQGPLEKLTVTQIIKNLLVKIHYYVDTRMQLDLIPVQLKKQSNGSEEIWVCENMVTWA
jgi:hypothetical protein